MSLRTKLLLLVFVTRTFVRLRTKKLLVMLGVAVALIAIWHRKRRSKTDSEIVAKGESLKEELAGPPS